MKAPLQAAKSFGSAASSAKQLASKQLKTILDNRPAMVAQRRLQGVAQAKGMEQQVQNRTRLPENLKAGLENLSGYSLDDVRVYYNSSKPAELNAHAYAQGAEIHVAPGQERHLPHEAWHVVQQKQGRVRATMQLKGISMNSSWALEREADMMGARALRKDSTGVTSLLQQKARVPKRQHFPASYQAPVQRMIRIKDGSLVGEYTTAGGKDTKRLIAQVEKRIGAKLRRGWKSGISRMAADDKKHKYYNSDLFRKVLLKKYQVLIKPKKRIRPGFPSGADYLGKVTLGLQTGKNQANFSPSANNAALPHRFPYADIQRSTKRYLERHETSADLLRWSNRLLKATEKRRDLNQQKLKGAAQNDYVDKVNLQITRFLLARGFLVTAVDGGQTLTLEAKQAQDFLKWTNGLHGNIPDYGPHTTVNVPVSDRLHMHFVGGELTPGSQAAGSMTPTRTRGLAVTQDGQYFVTTDGEAFPVASLTQADANLLSKHAHSGTTLSSSSLNGHSF